MLAQLKRLDVLVGIVEHGVKMRADIDEREIDRVYFPQHRAAELAGGIGGGVGCLGIDEVDDRFGLREVHAAV